MALDSVVERFSWWICIEWVSTLAKYSDNAQASIGYRAGAIDPGNLLFERYNQRS